MLNDIILKSCSYLRIGRYDQFQKRLIMESNFERIDSASDRITYLDFLSYKWVFLFTTLICRLQKATFNKLNSISSFVFYLMSFKKSLKCAIQIIFPAGIWFVNTFFCINQKTNSRTK